MPFSRTLAIFGVSCSLLFVAGCQDGPLYALKAANPYYTMGDWKKDAELGVTDHQRRKELASLADSIASLPPERQEFWTSHLEEIIADDDSAEMRRLAVRAAGGINSSAGVALINKGLEDDSSKVRMQACESLSRRNDDESARMLAAAVGTETDQDVRHAAISALARHKSSIATQSLRVALEDRDPATRSLVIASLQDSTGMNHGNDPQAWIAALDQKSSPATHPATTLESELPGSPFGNFNAEQIAQQPSSTFNR